MKPIQHRARFLVLTIAAVFIATFLVSAWVDGDHEQAPILNPVAGMQTPGVDQLSRSLSALRRSVDAIRVGQGDLEADLDDLRHNVPVSGEQISSGSISTRPRTTPEEIDSRISTQVDVLDAQLAAADTDPEWSQWAARDLQQSLTASNAEVGDLVDLECRANLCRAHLAYAGMDQRDAGLSNFPKQLGWSAQGFFEVIGDDGLEAVFYISREGHDLPDAS